MLLFLSILCLQSTHRIRNTVADIICVWVPSEVIFLPTIRVLNPSASRSEKTQFPCAFHFLPGIDITTQQKSEGFSDRTGSQTKLI